MIPETRHQGDGPRLLNLHQAATYIGVSYWTMRDWLIAGYLPVVELPPMQPRAGQRPRRALRRTLIDRGDLDAFISSRKRTATP
jgi:hypothetical protein